MDQELLRRLIENPKFIKFMAEAISDNETMREKFPGFADLADEEKKEIIKSVFAGATTKMLRDLVRNANRLASAEQ